jgi:hypothetical protein
VTKSPHRRCAKFTGFATDARNLVGERQIKVIVQNTLLDVNIFPTFQAFKKPGESHSHSILIKNKTEDPVTANIAMSLKRQSSCLSVTSNPASSLNIPAKGEASTSFTVKAGDGLTEGDDLYI